MLALCLQSLVRYCKWLGGSLWLKDPTHAPLCLRRILFLLLCPLLLLIQLTHWIGFLLDEIFFPRYRSIQVREPVFITGIPRSGTTFVHRSLARDKHQFSTVSTWEALLAPSICARKLIAAVAVLDRRLGAPLAKAIAALTRRAAGDFNAIHAVTPDAPEEDYLWLLPAASCLILLLAFPESRYLAQMAALDTLPKNQSKRLLDFYERCIQRHLYAGGKGRRFLSKNAAFASWCPALRQRFPDAKFLLCIREPSEALRSQLSSLAPARRIFGTDPTGTITARLFTEIFKHNYKALADFTRQQDPKAVALIDQADLSDAPGPVTLAALNQLELSTDPALREYLAQLKARHQSQHDYPPHPAMAPEIEVYLQPSYRTLIDRRVRLHNVS
jgi:hypothetical protein